jgi:uncharacterized protein
VTGAEATRSLVQAYLSGAIGRPLVSEFAVAEVGSAISRYVRMKELSPEDAVDRLRAFDIWVALDMQTVELTPIDVRVASNLVRRFDLKLRTPDALHLASCMRLGVLLVCLDRRMAAAAEALDIPVQLLA